MNDFTGWTKGLTVTADGDAVIPHAGAAALRLTADRTGLTTALSRVLHRDGFTPGHDRGRVITDAAVMMANGGNTIRGIDVLRHQPDLLGEVASPATLSRALGKVDQATLDRLDTARAAVRAQVWELIVARHGRIPPARVPTGDLGEQIVLRIDAHFIDVYSRKEHAGKLRGRYGMHPMAVICDNTGECLAEKLRPGTAGANDADDHIELLTRAVEQLPPAWRTNLLITIDGAGATHKLLDWIVSLNRPADGDDPGMRVEYSVGWPVDKLPTPLALDTPHPGHLPAPVRPTRPSLKPTPPSDRQDPARLENGARRGDTRPIGMPSTRKSHPTTTNHPPASTQPRS